MSTQVERFSISVPASSANLGPGFDCAALALSLRMRATVGRAPRFALSFERTPHMPSHDGLSSLFRRALHAVDPALPAVHVHVSNDIPLGKGLGSSAAAIVLALAVAMRARGDRPNMRAIARIAAAIEGHPDNALAAVYGGVIVAADAGHFLRFACPAEIQPVLVVPEIDLDTQSARMLLPASYERADAVFSVQRAALLGAALACGNVRALREAMRDLLHQPYRATRISGLGDALAVRDKDLAGAALSGAGPSVLALVRNGASERLALKLRAPFERAGIATSALPLRFSASGVQVRATVAKACHAA